MTRAEIVKKAVELHTSNSGISIHFLMRHFKITHETASIILRLAMHDIRKSLTAS